MQQARRASFRTHSQAVTSPALGQQQAELAKQSNPGFKTEATRRLTPSRAQQQQTRKLQERSQTATASKQADSDAQASIASGTEQTDGAAKCLKAQKMAGQDSQGASDSKEPLEAGHGRQHVIVFSNGATREDLPNGESITRFPNGDVKHTLPDGELGQSLVSQAIASLYPNKSPSSSESLFLLDLHCMLGVSTKSLYAFVESHSHWFNAPPQNAISLID